MAKIKQEELFHKLTLLLEVATDGYSAALKYKFGEELEYVKTLEGKSSNELKIEKQRLRAELYAL